MFCFIKDISNKGDDSMLKEIEKWVSIRSYKKDDVPEEKIISILEAARRAPSWSNLQPWYFIIVKDYDTKKNLRKHAMGQKMIMEAPVVIVCCGDTSVFSLDNHKKHIFELVEVGALKIKKEVVEQVLLKNEKLIPALKGDEEINLRVKEQMGFASAFMVIEAAHQGLGSCIIGGLDNSDVSIYELLSLPNYLIPLLIITIGYPNEYPLNRPRKPLKKITSKEKFYN
jgi:nitroreductase